MTLLTLPPRKWKWRMRGAALAFERDIRSLRQPPQALVVTDMLNLPELLSLLRDTLPPRLPVIAYFHENQMTYPLAVRDERDLHFGLANVYTALSSDRVVFNSVFHRDEFLDAVTRLLEAMPDFRPPDVARRIRARSEVLGVPVDVPPMDVRKEPLILWNHRWEEDKDPEAFFTAMRGLDAAGAPFRLMVLGQSFQERPACFAAAERDLAHRIERWGYVPDRGTYLREVARCRFVVSTARHEFYGLAVREAIAAGCHPLLPRRVVYPEMVGGRDAYLYDGIDDLVARLRRLLEEPADAPPPDLAATAASLTPARVADAWDGWLEGLCA